MLFTNSLLSLALALPALAIPPPDFGFPEAPNDTALTIRFQHGQQTTLVQEAALYGINITQYAPALSLNATSYQSLSNYTGNYTVLMVDPDASYPERPTSRFILHWMQANLTESATNATTGERTLTNASQPYVPFRRPSPPTNSSAHRYILYAFQQPANFSVPPQWTGLSASNRSSFNLTRFIDDARLGTPAAANYFYVSNETDVPANFTAAPGGQYPGGDGSAVTSGDPYRPTAGASSASAGNAPSSSTSSAGAAGMTGVGSLVGAGLVGLVALL